MYRCILGVYRTTSATSADVGTKSGGGERRAPLLVEEVICWKSNSEALGGVRGGWAAIISTTFLHIE